MTHCKQSTRHYVDEYVSLPVSILKQIISKSQLLDSQAVQVRLRLGETMQRVFLPIDTTDINNGGLRRWWLCPDCGRRCRDLLVGNDRVACRKCQGAEYRSQTEWPRFERKGVRDGELLSKQKLRAEKCMEEDSAANFCMLDSAAKVIGAAIKWEKLY